jgi:hypothetical protein
MAIKNIGRRNLLRGLGGAALALPALEAMHGGRANAQDSTLPKRFVVMFGGCSIGKLRVDSDPTTTDLFAPDTVGPDYDVKTALVPLQTRGVRDRVSVVSGLTLPWGELGSLPPGGRISAFHNACFGPTFCGMRTPGMFPVGGPSADQTVGEAIGQGTRVQTMAYRVQAGSYGDSRDYSMSFRNGPSGLQEVTPKTSPALIFSELFDGFVPPGVDPEVEAVAARLRARRQMALDIVGRRTESLMGRVSASDRARLQEHLEHVRALHERIGSLGTTQPGEGCSPPSTAPVDPALGAAYGGEIERGELIVDLMHMALTCDISRTASLQITLPQCGMNMLQIIGVDKNLHDIGHSSDDPGQPGQRLEQMSQAVAWHVDLFARLVEKLRDTPEGEGSVLDNTALVLVFEGGHGFDPQTNENNRVHSTENMAALIAGGAGGMTQGIHVRASGKHPGAVVNTAMHAVGVTTGFGEVTDTIPEILG